MKILVTIIVALFLSSLLLKSTELNFEMIGPEGCGAQRVFPVNSDYVAITFNGIYKSMNQCQSWEFIGGLPISFDNIFSDGGALFGVTPSNAGSNAVMISYDFGLSWQDYSNGLPTSGYSRFISSDMQANLWTNRGSKIFKMPGGETTWQQVADLSSFPGTPFLTCLKSEDDIIIAGTSEGIIISEDGGENWEVRNTGFGNGSNKQVNSVLIFNDTFIISLNNNNLYKSTDKGMTWVSKGTDGTFININEMVNSCDKFIISSYLSGAFISEDLGESWENIYTDNVYGLIQYSGYVIMSTPQGILLSEDDGMIFTVSNSGINEVPINGFLDIGNSILCHDASGYLFDYKNSEWRSLGTINGQRISDFVLYQNTIYAGTEGGGFWSSSDMGASWNIVSRGIWDPDVKTLAIDSTGRIYVGTHAQIFVSDDSGQSWTELIPTGSQSPICTKFFITPDNNAYLSTLSYGMLYIRNGDPQVYAVNNGMNFSYPLIDIILDNDGYLIGVNGNGSLRIKTETSIDWSMPSLAMRVKKIAYSNSSGLVVSTDQGLMQTFDRGESWTTISTTYNHELINKLYIDSENYLYLGTIQSVIKSLVPVTTSTGIVDETDQNEKLLIYPNPGGEQRWLKYHSDKNENACIMITDIFGNEVCKSAKVLLIEGDNTIALDKLTVSKGIYLVSLETDSGLTYTTKLIK